MKKIFTLIFIFISFCLNAATYRNYIAHSVSGSTYTIWVNSDTALGEGVEGQICDNGGSPYTGYVAGTFDNTSVPGANWKIVITITTQSIPKLELVNRNQSNVQYGWTGCNIIMGVVLSTELFNYKAQKVNDIVKVDWQTVSEKGNTQFNIQRSANNQTWQTIGQVKATNNPSGAKYTFTDDAPLRTINYYRLQMVDNDGKATYSKVIAVNVKEGKQVLSVFPNPVKTELTVLTDGNTEGVSIFDMTGKMVRRINDNRSKLDLADLPNGVYFVRLLDKNGLAGEAVRFVKQ